MFQKLSTEKLQRLKQECDEKYYNTGEPTISDEQYDNLVEELKKRLPTSKSIGIGCKVRDEDNKTRLPFHLGSMDKIKRDEPEKLNSWLKKNICDSFVVSNKLNGVSCLLVYDGTQNNNVKMFTRGDGDEGSNISYFQNDIQHIPKHISKPLAVRGEIIISKKDFDAHYQKDFQNSLGLIVGTVNAKTAKPSLKHLQFIAYELITTEPGLKRPSENLEFLSKIGFKTVHYSLFLNENMTCESLATELSKRKAEYEFDMDGLIVQKNTPYDRADMTPDGNPRYAFAFKMLQESKETVVEEVDWNASKWGVLKPRIRVKPVVLNGSTVQYATAFNAKYILDHKINVGSKVLLTKSGDVIPFIVDVLSESETAKFPSEDTFEWNETQVEIVLKNKGDSKEVLIQRIIHFFVSLGIKHVNEGIITKLVDNGFDSIIKILRMTCEDFQRLPSFQEKLSKKIYESIREKMKEGIHFHQLMVASGIFGSGFGLRKAELLLKNLPDILFLNVSETDIKSIEGFGEKTAQQVYQKLPEFKKFFNDMKPYMVMHVKDVVVDDEDKNTSSPLAQKSIVFSGFRNEKLKKFILSQGGSVVDAVSKNTFCLVVPLKEGKSTTKVEKAQQLNIKIFSIDEFCSQFSIDV